MLLLRPSTSTENGFVHGKNVSSSRSLRQMARWASLVASLHTGRVVVMLPPTRPVYMRKGWNPGEKRGNRDGSGNRSTFPPQTQLWSSRDPSTVWRCSQQVDLNLERLSLW